MSNITTSGRTCFGSGSARRARSFLGGIALVAAAFAVVSGCSSSDVPTETKEAGVSASQLSGRYEPGSPDTAWLWFDGTSAVKGAKKDGTSFDGAYAIEKVSAGYELVLKVTDGSTSRYPFKPGKTFKDQQTASSLSTGNLHVRSDSIASENEGCPEATSSTPKPEATAEPASRASGEIRPAAAPLLSGCSQLLDGLGEVFSAMTTEDVESVREAGTPKGTEIARAAKDKCGGCPFLQSCKVDKCVFCSDTKVAGCNNKPSQTQTCPTNYYCTRNTGTYSCRQGWETNKVVGRCS